MVLKDKMNGSNNGTIRTSRFDEIAGKIGNPLAGLGELAIFLYIGMSGMSLFYCLIVPNYIKNYPVDAQCVRFLLSTNVELKRIDSKIRAKIVEVRSSVLSDLINKASSVKRCSRFTMRTRSARNFEFSPSFVRDLNHEISPERGNGHRQERSSLFRRAPIGLDDFLSANEMLDQCSSRVQYFRSDIHTSKWFVQLINLLARDIKILSTYNYLWLVLVEFYLLLGPCSDDHKRYQDGNNTLRDRFSIGDIVYFIELTINMAILSQVTLYHIFSVIFAMRTQINAIQSFGLSLSAWRGMLFQLEEVYRNLRADGNASNGGSKIIHDLVKRERFITLQLLIAIPVQMNDIASAFAYLSVLVSGFLYHISSACFVLFASALMQSDDSQMLLGPGLIFTWCLLNCSMIASSHLNALVLRATKSYWFILADLSHLQELRRSLRSSIEVKQDNLEYDLPSGIDRGRLPIDSSAVHSDDSSDVIAKLWRRFVHESYRTSSNLSVKPFSVIINYKRTLELNIFLLFVYSVGISRLYRN